MRSLRLCVGGFVVMVGVASSGFGQTLQQRIDGVRQARAREAADGQMERLNIQARLRDLVDPVDISDATLRNTIRWYSTTTGIPVVIDWRAMASEGIDPERRITIQMRHIPAGQLLALIMKMAVPDDVPGAMTLMYETSPWYVQILTKRQADQNLIVRVYEVGDLLMEIPNFDDAPTFDLNDVLSNTNSGGSSSGNRGSGSSSLFRDEGQVKETGKSKAQRGEELAQLIRDTVEPDVWVERGGLSSIRYHSGRLVVSAPRYVHAKIGMPVISVNRDVRTTAYTAYPATHRDRAGDARRGKSAVHSMTTGKVSSVGE